MPMKNVRFSGRERSSGQAWNKCRKRRIFRALESEEMPNAWGTRSLRHSTQNVSECTQSRRKRQHSDTQKGKLFSDVPFFKSRQSAVPRHIPLHSFFLCITPRHVQKREKREQSAAHTPGTQTEDPRTKLLIKPPSSHRRQNKLHSNA